MTLAMTRPWKHPKTGMYWLRKRVPDDLQSIIGKSEEKRTLGTKDPFEAKQKLAQMLIELDAKWANLRKGTQQLTELQCHQLAMPIYSRYYRIFEDKPSDQRAWSVELGVKGLWGPEPSNYPAHLIGAYYGASGWQERCFRDADEILEAGGLTVDKRTHERLARAVSAAYHRASVDLEKLALGQGLDPESFTQAAVTRPSRLRLDDLVRDWAAEKKPAQKTLYEWSRVFEELKAFLGHDDASRISSVELNNWKAHLLAAGRRAKTIRDAKIAPVKAILQWGVDNDRLVSNPAARVVLDVKENPIERKRGFNDREAAIVLTAARKEKSDVLRWIPWLCAYTGARIAEISQLRSEDVFEVEGIWCLRITAEAGPLKTSSSERVLPIHSALIAEGFLKFWKSVSAGPLFPGLKPNKFGSRGGNGTKIVGRWVRGLGLTDPRISPSHSWRHRLKTLSRRHALSSDIVDAIVGHGKRSIGDQYGEFPTDALKRELEKIPRLELGDPNMK